MKTRIKIGESRLNVGHRLCENYEGEANFESKELVIGAMEIELDYEIKELSDMWELKKKIAEESDEVIRNLEDAIFGAVTRVKERLDNLFLDDSEGLEDLEDLDALIVDNDYKRGR